MNNETDLWLTIFGSKYNEPNITHSFSKSSQNL